MAESTTEVVTGGAVLVAAIAFLAYASQSVGFSGNASSYEVKASFRSVEGISVGTDVRLAGVKIGSVTQLALNPQTYFADATVSVQNDVALPVDSAILVSSEGLLGGNYVELIPGGSLENIEPGGEIEDTQGAVSLISLLMKFVGGAAGDAISANDADDPAAPETP